jgi:hypothetical protein
MDQLSNFIKALFEKLLKEAFTTVLLVVIAYYFVAEERKTKKELLDLYKEDRKELLKTIENRNKHIFELYQDLIEKNNTP